MGMVRPLCVDAYRLERGQKHAPSEDNRTCQNKQ